MFGCPQFLKQKKQRLHKTVTNRRTKPYSKCWYKRPNKRPKVGVRTNIIANLKINILRKTSANATSRRLSEFNKDRLCCRKSITLILLGLASLNSGATVGVPVSVALSENNPIFYDMSQPRHYPFFTNNGSIVFTQNKTEKLKLPDLGNGSTRFIEQHEHQALGEWSVRQLNKNSAMLEDPWVYEVLSNLAWQINAKARNQAPLALMVIDNPNINAFAIPGGVIGINTGTVLAANSMGEVASVLAHEVAHLSQRHYEHRDSVSRKALIMQIGTILAAIAASSADGDAAAAILMGGQTAALNSRMAFSRDNEREADRIGMQILSDSGFDPHAMPQFFAALNQRNQLNNNRQSFLPSFMMTHPLSTERLSEAQSRANSYTSNLAGRQSKEHDKRRQLFDLLKWRVGVVSNQTQEAELVAAATQSKGAKLALATYYTSKGRYASAQTALKPFSMMPIKERQGFEPLLSITQAALNAQQGQWDQAVTLLKRQQRLYPERRDLRLYLADALLQTDRPIQSQALLLPLLKREAHDIDVLKRLKLSYEYVANQAILNDEPNLSNNTFKDSKAAVIIATINALRYRSRSELWQGQYDEAQVSLQQAKTVAQSLQDSEINPKPLLAKINSEMEILETTKAYHP